MLRPRVLVLLAIALGALLAGCGGTPSHPASAPGHRDRHRPVPAHSMSGDGMPGIAHGTVEDRPLPPAVAAARLVDQHGRGFTMRMLRGRIVVLAPLPGGCARLDAATARELHRVALTARQALIGDRVVALGIGSDRQAIRRLAGRLPALPDLLLATGSHRAVDSLWARRGPSCGRVPVLVLDVKGRVRWTTTGRPGAPGGWDADRVDEAVAYVHDAPSG